MKVRVKSVPQQLNRNSRKWKHGNGGPLVNLFYPGSTRQYAKALSKMLSAIYAASKIKDLTTE